MKRRPLVWLIAGVVAVLAHRRTTGPESIYPFLHGKFCVHALAAFDFNGRPGKGLLENSPPRFIPPTYVDRYGLEPAGMTRDHG